MKKHEREGKFLSLILRYSSGNGLHQSLNGDRIMSKEN
jgi:hypothetical protein